MPNAHVNGIDIWYDVTGPDDGKPLLLISGVGTQSTRSVSYTHLTLPTICSV